MTRFPMTPAAAALFLALGAAACGGEARSAGDTESERIFPGALEEGMPVEDFAGEAPLPEAAADAVAEATPAPAPRRDRPVSTPPSPELLERTDRTPPPLENPTPALERLAVPAGATLAGELEVTLSTDRNSAGDPFTARLREDHLGADGVVLLPRGSVIRGRILESRESPSADEPATLVLQVEAMEVNGVRLPVVATVVETQLRTEARDSGGRTAAKVATGAAAGAVVGRILGRDTRSTAAGAAAGAAAGTAVALATRDGHGVLDGGTLVVIRLDQPLYLEP
jgi:hypothetical protein